MPDQKLSPQQTKLVNEITENLLAALDELKDEFDENNPENRLPDGTVTSFVMDELYDPNETVYKRPGGFLKVIEMRETKNDLTGLRIMISQVFKNEKGHLCTLTESITTDGSSHRVSLGGNGLLYIREAVDTETNEYTRGGGLISPGDEEGKVFLIESEERDVNEANARDKTLDKTEVGSFKYFCKKIMEIKTQFGCADPQPLVFCAPRDSFPKGKNRPKNEI